jgi:hypothetical protein
MAIFILLLYLNNFFLSVVISNSLAFSLASFTTYKTTRLSKSLTHDTVECYALTAIGLFLYNVNVPILMD